MGQLLYMHCPSICLEGMGKTTKSLSHDSWCLDRDSNLSSPEYNQKRNRLVGQSSLVY